MRPFMQFLFALIGIEDVILLGMTRDPPIVRGNRRPVLRYGLSSC